jgi:hypothetical protein
MQTAQSRDGTKYSDIPSLSLSVLELYQSVFGFGPANLAIPTKKPFAPGHHITSLKRGPVFKREDLLPDLELYWMKCHEAVCWLPCLADDIAPNLLLPAINLIMPFALHASDDVQAQAQLTLSSIVSRTGPCGVARVACATLERLAEPCLADNDIPGLMKLMQKLAAVYKTDWTLSVALSTRLLHARSRSYKKVQANQCIDDMWRASFVSARWIPAAAPARLTPDCLLPSALGDDLSSLSAPSATPPSQVQDIVIRVMQSEWSKLHSKYQQRCLALLAEVSSKDAHMSQDQWSFLWQLLPRTVGFGCGEKSSKCSAAYVQLLQMFELALNALCPASSSLSSSFTLLPLLCFPLIESTGNIQESTPVDPRIAVVKSFFPLLNDDQYICSFVLAAAAAYEVEKRGDNFKQQSNDAPLCTLRISIFRLCIEVFGLHFLHRACEPYFSALNGNFTNRFMSPPFFPKINDQEAMDSYMYLSNDMMVGCLLGALALPQQVRSQVASCILSHVSTLTLSTVAMPPSYRYAVDGWVMPMCNQGFLLLVVYNKCNA